MPVESNLPVNRLTETRPACAPCAGGCCRARPAWRIPFPFIGGKPWKIFGLLLSFLALSLLAAHALEWEMMGKFVVDGAATMKSSVTLIVPETQPASLWASSSTVTPHLYVSTTGRVGIGTANPEAKLHVVGVSSFTGSIYIPENDLYISSGIAGQILKKNVGGWLEWGYVGVPTGTIAFFDQACPAGWYEVTAAQGRYLVGLPSGGTLGGTAGTLLSNQENRAVGVHNHGISDPTHTHNSSYLGAWNNAFAGSSYYGGDYAQHYTLTGYTGISINNTGSVAGTNAPYTQYRACKCTDASACSTPISSGGSTPLAINLAGGAAGALAYQSSPNNTTFLNIGANNTALTSNGSVPAWAGVPDAALPANVAFLAASQIFSGSNTFSGSLTVPPDKIFIDNGATGQLLKKNAGGYAEWGDASGVPGDHLGNHTATTVLNMNGQSMVNVASATFNNSMTAYSTVTIIAPVNTGGASLWVSTSAVTPHLYVSTNGIIGLGTAAPGYKLDVSGGDINVSGAFREAGTAGIALTCAAGEIIKGGAVSGGILTAGTCASGLAAGSQTCPSDSVQVGELCVDKYEGSIWSTPSGGTQYGTASDDYTASCDDNGQNCTGVYARSVSGVTPSRWMTWFQASAACRNAGKRLLTSAEWTEAARGTPDPGAGVAFPGCNVNTHSPTPSVTGGNTGCLSAAGAENMVGSLWERVADWGLTAITSN